MPMPDTVATTTNESTAAIAPVFTCFLTTL
jgi:hypothetical protein